MGAGAGFRRSRLRLGLSQFRDVPQHLDMVCWQPLRRPCGWGWCGDTVTALGHKHKDSPKHEEFFTGYNTFSFKHDDFQ